ncbi:MAG: RiPP maturation radical SAM protein 1 [Desulfobacteraceae bacterium]|nr:RiPP maturation radical SAM protein 1 [Desulfobacteraceae bacterium]
MIHLINMPFGQITYPSLATGLIKAQLDCANIGNRVFYLNFDLADRMGFDHYYKIAAGNVQINEWLFAGEAWNNPPPMMEPETFIGLYDLKIPLEPEKREKLAGLKKVRQEIIPAFLESSFQKIKSCCEPQIVGFSCTYFQTLSSLALGRLIKSRYPAARIVYGGAAFHGEMGKELIKKCEWIDAVSTGEADDIVIELFNALNQGKLPINLQGVLYRDKTGNVQKGKPGKSVEKRILDALPAPDFTDFFETAAKFRLLDDPSWRKKAVIPFETSRGCWWGKKKQCSFCGLNNNNMTFREKSADRVCHTLNLHLHKYPVRSFYATDNNLAMSSFNDLIPKLKKQFHDANFFFSVKPNLKREQIKALARANVTSLGPGIESLSTHLLKLMRKGVSALENVYFLKCCREYGIYPRWNILMRVPGEKQEDYQEMEELFPKLYHLAPPFGFGKIQCHRFSPYFNETELYAENRHPEPWYKALFPSDHIDLSRVAYSFKADWKAVLDDGFYKGVTDKIVFWRGLWTRGIEKPSLAAHNSKNGCFRIEDTRDGELKTCYLNNAESLVYEAISDPADTEQIFSACLSRARLPLSTIKNMLSQLLEQNLVIEENRRYLALAVNKNVALQ